MELQWPLILFTAFVAWAGGLLATQGIFALKKEGDKTQMTATITTLVLLVIGGIAVFMHLQHWERIFNGFGHLSSGITQELIGIVLMIVVLVLIFLQLRKEDGKIPAWLAVVAIVVALGTVIVTAHSYMMASRPAWNTFMWALALIGNACILGPLTFIFLDAVKVKEDKPASFGLVALIGAVLNALGSLLYVFVANGSSSQFAQITYYYDPTEPMREMVDAASTVNAFANPVLVWVAIVIIGVVVPIVAAFLGSKKPTASNWMIWSCVGLVCALIGAICIRVLFFQMGASVFIFY